jgi:iron complex transport system substrate-binding protein
VNLDLEKIVSLHPDLCLATKDGNPIDVIKRLENIGIPVYALDPRDLPTVLETIEVLGGLLNATQQANAVSDNMRQRIELVKNRVAKCQWNPRVFFQIGIAPIVSVGKQTFIHELISLAGGVNAASGPTDYPRFSREEVLVLRPDIIVINSMTKDDKLLERAIEQWNRFPNIPAVKNKRIYSVNSDYFDRASPRLVSGLEILAKLFHPRIFSDLESVD